MVFSKTDKKQPKIFKTKISEAFGNIAFQHNVDNQLDTESIGSISSKSLN